MLLPLLLSAALTGSAPPPTALGISVFESFEFHDVSGSFQVGVSPAHVRFEDGLAQSVGIVSLYRSGFFSWMIEAGETGEITFGLPAEKITLFLRDSTASVGSILTFYDAKGVVISTFNGNTAGFQSITVGTKARPVGRITLEHNGATGWAIIDDFSYSALDTFGATYCTPVANSTGFPGFASASGSELVSENDLTLYASSLPRNEFGFWLVAANADSILVAPASVGILCLEQPIGRFMTQIVNSGERGMIHVDVDLTALPLTPSVAVVPGDTWRFQAWHRQGATSNFTEPIAIDFQ
tara:strand:+ start:5273 stop:6163 length:891 start_codon:yes stop_codon:yes gene_type:complete